MPAEKRCPTCQRVMPLLATECLYCRPPRPAPTAPAADAEPRYSVIRSGNGAAGRANGAPAPAAPASKRPVLREDEAAWYCRIGGQIIGPVTAFEIRDAFTKGQIDGEASIGVRGHKDWFPIKELPQFADLVTRPTLAAPGYAEPPRPAPRPAAAEPRDLIAPPAPVALPRTRTPPPRPAAAPAPAPILPPRPVVPPGREDDTLVVTPLPPPGPGQTPDGSPAPPSSGTLQAWQAEVKRLRGQVRLLLVVSGVLLSLSLVLLLAWMKAKS